MFSITRLAAAAAVLLGLVALGAARAEEPKPADGGKGSEHRSKAYDIKEKGETVITLTFEAGKEVTVITKGDAETDIHLLMKSKYYEWKDTSPTPVCLLKFTPVKGDDKFTFTLKNVGSNACKVTLDVKVAE